MIKKILAIILANYAINGMDDELDDELIAAPTQIRLPMKKFVVYEDIQHHGDYTNVTFYDRETTGKIFLYEMGCCHILWFVCHPQ